MPHLTTDDGSSYIMKRLVAEFRSFWCTNSLATCVPMRCSCATLANGIAASPTTREAIRHLTCPMTERVIAGAGT